MTKGKKAIVVDDFIPTELNDRDKLIGRKPMGEVKVDVRDTSEVQRDTLRAAKQLQRGLINHHKAEIKKAKLQIKKAKLEYKIAKG